MSYPICKMRSESFLSEREMWNIKYTKNWYYKYLRISLNPIHNNYEFKCTVIYDYELGSGQINKYMMSETISTTDPIGEEIIDMLKTKWNKTKKEDENENDTIAALLLGIARLDGFNYISNNLILHETIVSIYDIKAKRSERAQILDMKSALKSKIMYKVKTPVTFHEFARWSQKNTCMNCCIIIKPVFEEMHTCSHIQYQ